MHRLKSFKDPRTYLFMKKKHQRFLGWILFIAGLVLMASTFVPELINNVQINFNSTDLISICIGFIMMLIGWGGIRKEW